MPRTSPITYGNSNTYSYPLPTAADAGIETKNNNLRDCENRIIRAINEGRYQTFCHSDAYHMTPELKAKGYCVEYHCTTDGSDAKVEITWKNNLKNN